MKNFLLLILTILGINQNIAQNCSPPTANIDLDINNIRAKILNGGDMWWDGSNPKYEFPKLPEGSAQTPKFVAFANGLWMSAKDGNDLKIAAMTYRSGGYDFWSGPILSGDITIQDTISSKFDRFFEVYKTEVKTHVNNINTKNLPLVLNTISTGIKEWPGKGNKYLEYTYNMSINEPLAPFFDFNENGIYDSENGDYPLIKGDQCIFWVINDIGNIHSSSGGDALGVEIQCMAYAYNTSNAVNNTTFYDYKIIKKTNGTLQDFYFSSFIDSDIGDASDDYIGSDSTKNYAFACNGDAHDYTYGSTPPIFVNQFVNFSMSNFIYFNSSTNSQGSPSTPVHFREYQKSTWKDGSKLTNDGGIGTTGTNFTNYVYPGNPASGAGWSECSAGAIPSDRKFVMSSGPYTLVQNSPIEFTIASITIPTNLSFDQCFDKTVLIDPVVSLVDSFIDTVNNNPYEVTKILAINDFSDINFSLEIFPNPTSHILNLKLQKEFKISDIQIYDIKGFKMQFDLHDETIKIAHFSKGIYSLKLYSENLNRMITKKFVVQ